MRVCDEGQKFSAERVQSYLPPARGTLLLINLDKVVDAIDEIAAETGKTVPQIALNWLLQRPTVSTVIIGARNEEQLIQN